MKTKYTTLCVKQTKFTLTGRPEHLQKIMADVHYFIGSHPLVKGGKKRRKVSVSHKSTAPTKIFEGKL